MSEEQAKFDQWAIVEVMGHKKYAGRVTEQQLAGAALVRVDVPEVKVGERVHPAFTKLVGVGSIYMLTPVTEELARKAAARIAYEGAEVIPVYIPAERQIAGPSAEELADAVDTIDDDDDEVEEAPMLWRPDRA